MRMWPLSVGRIAACLSVISLAVVVWLTPEPDGHLRSLMQLCDFGHVVAFGLIVWLLLVMIGAPNKVMFSRWVLSTVIAALVSVLLGTAVEVLQAASGGNGDPGDVVRDAGGACSAALLAIAWRAPSRNIAFSSGGLAVTVAAIFFQPTLHALWDELRAWREFPVLVGFQNRTELERFADLPAVTEWTRYQDNEGQQRNGLKMQLPAAKYPGFTLRHFPGDWRGWRALDIDLTNFTSRRLTFNVRMDDAQYRDVLDMADRYDGEFTVMPGQQTIEVRLADVQQAPRGRLFDLGQVRLVLLHGVNFTQSADVLLRGLRLVP